MRHNGENMENPGIFRISYRGINEWARELLTRYRAISDLFNSEMLLALVHKGRHRFFVCI